MISALGTWLQARLPREEDGASLVEYLLLVSLIAMAVIGAVVFLGGALRDTFNSEGSQLSNVP
jgi:Flp pilus assembly pilin Flp